MVHDPLCLSEQSGFCLECATIETIREDERYRVLEQLGAMSSNTSLYEVMEVVRPVEGDSLRRREPRADLGFR